MRTSIGIVGAALLIASASANASLLWNFNYTNGSTVDVTGTLTTVDTLSSGSYLVTGISGVRNGTDVIASLLSAPSFNTFGFDNLLLQGQGSLLDVGGLAFTTQSGGAFNICGSSPPFAGYVCGSAGYTEFDMKTGVGTSVRFTASKVPEPATLSLFGLGLVVAGLGAVRRRSKRELTENAAF